MPLCVLKKENVFIKLTTRDDQRIERNKTSHDHVCQEVTCANSSSVCSEEKCVVYTPYYFSVSAWAEVRL
jgi:hypothetical protein